MINPNRVNEMFLDVLFEGEEIMDPEDLPEGAVVVEGVMGKFAMASFQMPREMWSALPGGMPYVVLDV